MPSKQFVFVLMDDDQRKKPEYFALKKYCLLALMAVNVVGLVYYSYYAFLLTDREIHRLTHTEPQQYNSTIKMLLCIVVGLLSLLVVAKLFFVVGIVRESTLLTTVYLVLISMATVAGAVRSVCSDRYFWSNTIWLAVTVLFTGLYLIDLRLVVRRERERVKRHHQGHYHPSSS